MRNGAVHIAVHLEYTSRLVACDESEDMQLVQIQQLKRAKSLCDQIRRESQDARVGLSLAVVKELFVALSALDASDDIREKHRTKFIERRSQLGNFAANGGSTGGAKASMADVSEALEDALKQELPAAATRFPGIRDGEFRSLLERDLLEAEQSADQRNWKSCVVMCGSVLEAALYEYLLRNPGWTMDAARLNKPTRRGGVVKDIQARGWEDQWTLKELIDFACANNLLRQYNADTLHNTLREPRNLIHPMKEIRREQWVNEHSAQVSLNMVRSALAELGQLPDPV